MSLSSLFDPLAAKGESSIDDEQSQGLSQNDLGTLQVSKKNLKQEEIDRELTNNGFEKSDNVEAFILYGTNENEFSNEEMIEAFQGSEADTSSSDPNQPGSLEVDNSSIERYDMAIDDAGKVLFKCQQCRYTAPKRSIMMRHITNVHDKILPYKCPQCGKHFRSSYHVKIHVNSVHEKLRPYKCSYCDSHFASPGNRKRHVRIKHESIYRGKAGREEKFKCELCDGEFTMKGNLLAHIRYVHEGEKEFQCEQCNASFTRKVCLQKHVIAIHDKSRDYVCDLCNASFCRKGSLKVHHEYVHEKKRPFCCEVCGKTFCKRGDLKTHMKVHNS